MVPLPDRQESRAAPIRRRSGRSGGTGDGPLRARSFLFALAVVALLGLSLYLLYD